MSPGTIFFVVVVVVFIVKPIVQRLIAGQDTATSGSSFTVARSGMHDAGQAPDEWHYLAQELGLQLASPKHGRRVSMRGQIEGLRVSIEDHRAGTRVEVDYNSGQREFDIRPATSSVWTNAEPVKTGNPGFDSVFQLHTQRPTDTLEFLTPLRQETLLALHSAVTINELDEDELEVVLPPSCSGPNAVDAVKLIVYAASALQTPSGSASPRDVTAPNPQDTIR